MMTIFSDECEGRGKGEGGKGGEGAEVCMKLNVL